VRGTRRVLQVRIVHEATHHRRDTVYPSPPGTRVPFKRTSTSNIKLTIPTFHLHPSRDTPKLTPEEIQTRLKAVPTWTLDPQGVAISRKFTAKNWKSALDFVNQLSIVAEEEGHHPDVHLTNWRDVEVVASTHAIGGLSLHDFVLAAKLDTIDVTYSPKWLRENAE
jgi:4a-hydroxytetrahydrobiopterin dehydratase